MLFPPSLPFVVGNDICRVARIRGILKGRHGPQFIRRILRTDEIDHPTTFGILRCILNQETQPKSQAPPPGNYRELPPGFYRAVEFMAGRFAAKEAVVKAHPHRRLTFQRISIVRVSGVLDPAPEEWVSVPESSRDQPENPATKGLARWPKWKDMAPEKVDEVEAAAEPVSDDLLTLASQGGALVAVVDSEGAHSQTCASVSISHDKEYATAVCVALNPQSPLAMPESSNWRTRDELF